MGVRSRVAVPQSESERSCGAHGTVPARPLNLKSE